MKAIVVRITFSEALFKAHHTKGFRQTYLIPLPTTVAGIFGAMLGIERRAVTEEFKNCLFGAKLLKYKGSCSENTTYIQHKTGKRIRGVTVSVILNHPTYTMALVADNEKIDEFYLKIKDRIAYFPYGGQNDFFAEDIEVQGKMDVEENCLIENYAPQDLIEKIEWNEGTELQILPVKHKFSTNPNFCFIFKGKLKLKHPVLAVDGIGVFPLEKFYYLES